MEERSERNDRVVDVRGDRLDSSRMFPPTTVVRYSVLDVCWTPTRLDPLFKAYQGTAHAVPASAEAAHPARGRADTEQHGLLLIFDFIFFINLKQLLQVCLIGILLLQLLLIV